MVYTEEHLKLIYQYPHLLSHLLGKDRATEMHSAWIKYIWDTEESRSLQAHRGSYKTTNVTAIGTIWYLLFHPNERIAIIRKTFTDAAKITTEIKQMMSKPEARELFNFAHGEYPDFTVKQNGRLEFSFKKQATPEVSIEGHGLDAGLTGSHYDRIITDDVITLKDRISKAERDKTVEILREIITNIIDPGKPVSHVGTPWHKNDGWSILPEPIKFDVHRTGLLSEEEIQKKRETTTPSLFAANYDLKHKSDELKLFTDPEFGLWQFNGTDIVAHVDAAYDGNHYCALTIMGRRYSDNRIQAIGWVYPGNVKNWINFIVDKCKKYRVNLLYNEDNPDKGYTADKIQYYGVPVSTYHESQNKHIKISSNLFEQWRNIVWANETDENYMEQIEDYEEKQEPDDAPDSAASLIQRHFKTNGASWLDALSRA